MIGRTNVLTGGGQPPIGTINITQNGQYNVSQYAQANVDVVDRTEIRNLLTNHLTEYSDNIITSLRANALRGLSSIRSLNLPNVTYIGQAALRECTALTDVSLPLLTSVANEAFIYCSSLKYIELPSLSSFSSTLFGTCGSLVTGVFRSTSSISGSSFINCSKFKNCIVPKKASLSNVNAFQSTPFKNGTGGTIYTNYDNVSWYGTATNWSALESTTFKSIQENLIELQSLGYNSTTQEWDYKVDISPYYEIVTELPTTDIDDTIVYFIETAISGTYEQWFHGSGSWEQLPNITLEEQTNG